MMKPQPQQHDDVPTDPQLDAILDEVLAPANPPPDLADKIIAATSPSLAKPQPAVLARIGWPMLRIAASILLVAGVGVALWVSGKPQATQKHGLESLLTELDQINQTLNLTSDEQIDQQIDMVNMQVDLVEATPRWAEEMELLDQAITQYELDRYMTDVNLFF